MSETDAIQGPAWDLSSEYPAPDSPEVAADFDEASALLEELEELAGALEGPDRVRTAQTMFKRSERLAEILRDLGTFSGCLLSVDGRDAAAQQLQGRLQNYYAKAGQWVKSLAHFTDLADESELVAYLDDPEVAPSEYMVRHSRRRQHEILSLDEEKLINGLSQDGIHAWGRLYDQLGGTLSCSVEVDGEVQQLGLAQTAGLMQAADRDQRKRAFYAINSAWEQHEETCAAAINAIAGWRLELCRKRSRTKQVHYLDAAVHMNRIERTTLDALMQVAEEARPLAQRVALLNARVYGAERYAPWDQRAPAPPLDQSEGKIPFAEAIDIVATAYAQVDDSMGDFVRLMEKNRWVEGTVGPTKRPGAYCTSFSKSRTPRVYMTYTGGSRDVITLAHEFGHAYHNWVMRDLPECQSNYGMSLAETASTFGETLVREAMLSRAKSLGERLDMVWEEMSALVAFMLNIPTRYEFERAFYDKRAARPLLAQELKDLVSESWGKWFGDSLEEPDPFMWASKLHFYISGLSFYNFPYLFGYLFSMGVYGKRAEFGAEFFPRYEALLRDTGRMSSEDVAKVHLDSDLTTPDFWRSTVAGLEARVDAFEEIVKEVEATR